MHELMPQRTSLSICINHSSERTIESIRLFVPLSFCRNTNHKQISLWQVEAKLTEAHVSFRASVLAPISSLSYFPSIHCMSKRFNWLFFSHKIIGSNRDHLKRILKERFAEEHSQIWGLSHKLSCSSHIFLFKLQVSVSQQGRFILPELSSQHCWKATFAFLPTIIFLFLLLRLLHQWETHIHSYQLAAGLSRLFTRPV